MRKVLKCIAFVLALGMVCSYATAWADDDATLTIENWNVVYNEPDSVQQGQMGSAYIPMDKDNCYADISESESFDGDKSIYLTHVREVKQNNTSIELLYDAATGMTNGSTYTISFAVKGDYEESGILAGFGESSHPRNGAFFSVDNAKFTKAEDGDWTVYSADLKYTTGDEVRIRLTHGCDGMYIDNVSVTDADGKEYINNGSFESSDVLRLEAGIPDVWYGSKTYYATTEDSYSGKASLRIKGKKDGTELIQGVEYSTSSFYNVSFYAKILPNTDYKWMAKVYLGAVNDTNQHLNAADFTMTETDKEGWVKFEAHVKPGADGNFHIQNQADNGVFDMYLDDISVVKDGDTENIIQNGGFEDYTVSEPVINSFEKTGYKEYTLSWTNGSVKSTAVRVYVDGAEVPAEDADLLGDAENSIVIRDVENTESHTIKIVNEINGLSLSAAETVESEAVDFEISEITLNDGADKLLSGDNTASVNISNYNVSDGIKGELIVLLEKGSLTVAVSGTAVNVPAGEEVTVAASVPAGDMTDGEYTLSVFLWDGFDGMTRLCPGTVFSE